MKRTRLIMYLRKQLSKQPIAVPGSGGGTTGGAPPPSGAGEMMGFPFPITKAS